MIGGSLGGCGDKGRAGRPERDASPATRAGADAAGALEAQRRARPRVRTFARVFARPGEAIIVPLVPSERAVAAGYAAVRIEGQDDVRAPLFVVGPAAGETPSDAPIAPAVRAFYGVGADWRSVPAADARGAVGAWVAAVNLPTDDRPDAIEVDGRGVELLWGEGDDAAPDKDEPAEPGPPAPGAADWHSVALAELRRSPLTRWRARLAAGEPIVQPPSAPDALRDRVADGLARQIEAQWQVGLDRLDRASAPVAARARARLAGVVALGSEGRLPLWGPSTDADALETLRTTLAAPETPGERLVEAAEAWLEIVPAAGALVIDDAAELDAANCAAGPALLLFNLSSAPASAWAGPDARGVDPPDLLALEPMGAGLAPVPARVRRVQIAGLADTPVERVGAGRYAAHVGGWTAVRASADRCARATPPGFALGPTLPDWTVDALLAAMADPTPAAPLPAPAAGAAVAGRLYRTTAEGGEAARWMVYLERTAPAGDGDGAAWEIVVHFGPSGRGPAGEPGPALRVASDGTLAERRAGAWVSAGRATMTRDDRRAAVWVPVPAGVVEGGSDARVLRVGLTHTDGLGRRSAWPRPMLPWADEPGRVAVDLSAWSPVE